MTSASFDAADEGEESAKEKRQHCTRKTHGMSGRRSEIGGGAALRPIKRQNQKTL